MADEHSTSLSLIEELLGVHADEIRNRAIRLRCEFDRQFQISEDAALEAALVDLFRFVFSTVPDGCEVFLASARTLAPVATLESGSLTLRWQTTGDERGGLPGNVTSLRPIVGSAHAHVQSKAASALECAFEAAGWGFELLAVNDDREIWLHVSTR